LNSHLISSDINFNILFKMKIKRKTSIYYSWVHV